MSGGVGTATKLNLFSLSGRILCLPDRSLQEHQSRRATRASGRSFSQRFSPNPVRKVSEKKGQVGSRKMVAVVCDRNNEIKHPTSTQGQEMPTEPGEQRSFVAAIVKEIPQGFCSGSLYSPPTSLAAFSSQWSSTLPIFHSSSSLLPKTQICTCLIWVTWLK